MNGLMKRSALGIMIFWVSGAWAQDMGALLGVHQTSADTSVSGAAVESQFNWRAGLALRLDLVEPIQFRTGLLYTSRAFEVSSGGLKTEYNFAYLDIPALVQYSVQDMLALHGGLIVAANVNDDVDPPSGTTAADPDADALIPLMQLGVTLNFDDMVGFDIYFERGFGSFAKDLKDYSAFGASFIYWL